MRCSRDYSDGLDRIDPHCFYVLKRKEILENIDRIASLAKKASYHIDDTGIKFVDEIRSIAITMLDKEVRE